MTGDLIALAFVAAWVARAARSGRIVIVVPCGSTANRFIEWGRR